MSNWIYEVWVNGNRALTIYDEELITVMVKTLLVVLYPGQEVSVEIRRLLDPTPVIII